MARILYHVNIARFFNSHRLPLAQAALKAGHEVHVATSDADEHEAARIRGAGLPFHALPLAQHGTNPAHELTTLRAVVSLYRRLGPDLVHHISIKPVLYGGIAARVAGIKAVVSAMSGLGFVFIDDSAKARVLRALARPGLRFALAHPNTRMVFQNPDDQQHFIEMGLIEERRTIVIRGSGVDTARFVAEPELAGTPVVLFAGRLMRKKGLFDFVRAAEQLHGRARFVVVGYAEPTAPDTVSEEELRAWTQRGLIEWWGRRDDMPRVFAQAHVICLPSTYGEGVPKVLIEAAACGRALVATDTPGCREIVRHELNGLLVKPGDEAALVRAVARLIENDQVRQRMGVAGREIVQREFAVPIVVDQTLALYEEMLGSKRVHVEARGSKSYAPPSHGDKLQ